MLRQRTSTSWEHRLLALAHEGLDSHHHAEPVPAEASLMESAYRYCEAITAEHSRTFYMASALLPDTKRRAVRALYAFCRISDDLVDGDQPEPLEKLLEWQERSLSPHPPEDDLVALAWADTRARYRIPRRYAEQLIEGVRRDLEQDRYESFEELSAYCYGAASTVGLMAMHIIGFEGRKAIPYALKLGVALQLTNILRDIGEDWQAGRVYLPQQELEEFGLDEKDLALGKIDSRWRAFMRFQIERNRQLYQEAAPGIRLLERDGRFAIAAAADLYQAILDDIEDHQGDVFTRRAHITKWGKIRRLPGIWWRWRN
ncbi:MAG: squalene/phytoene synthase family protein [Anaerolineales bacterium]|jgi:phytoene synthase